MSRIIKLKSVSGNGLEYVISRSLSQPKKYWNLTISEGKKYAQETGYSTIKQARKRISDYQNHDLLFNPTKLTA